MSAIERGAKVEAEHSGTIDFVKRHPHLPKKQIYRHIAKDHLRESAKYYDDLKTMEDFEEKTKTATMAAFLDELTKISSKGYLRAAAGPAGIGAGLGALAGSFHGGGPLSGWSDKKTRRQKLKVMANSALLSGAMAGSFGMLHHAGNRSLAKEFERVTRGGSAPKPPPPPQPSGPADDRGMGKVIPFPRRDS
jgi:hypothetical protein